MNWVRDEIRRHADDPDFRQAYVEDALRRRIAHQIRALRETLEWSQSELGERMGKPQGNISRLEDPAYGKWSFSTLFELAHTFGVAPYFEFISYEEFDLRTESLSRDNLAAALIATETASGSILSAAPSPKQFNFNRPAKDSVRSRPRNLATVIDVRANALLDQIEGFRPPDDALQKSAPRVQQPVERNDDREDSAPPAFLAAGAHGNWGTGVGASGIDRVRHQ